MASRSKRGRFLLLILGVLLLIVVVALGWGWWQMRGSLPQLDGENHIAGLGAAVKVERDALGTPTITGASRTDVARATGFVQAQDRYFQMDLLRRSGAGELAEIFGAAALPLDRAHRVHQFRRTAEKVLAALPAEQRALLEAYTAGANAGLAALPKVPWEYLVVRTTPQPWRAEDSLLVSYAMWFDLQDSTGQYEQDVRTIRTTLGQAGVDFFAPQGNTWDAALDGSTLPVPPLPPFHLKKPAAQPVKTTVSAPEPLLLPGSNNFAVDGAHTATGAAMLANDMHLSLGVPAIWYRAVLNWQDATGAAHRLAGVTLPGTPFVIAGSNGRIAWGFTNSYVDTTDVVLTEVDGIAQITYRTPHGWADIEDRSDPIKVKGRDSEPFTARWTEWGPIIGGPEGSRYLVLRWNAHNPESTNLNLVELETTTTVDDAVAIAHRTGMPNQNLLVADAAGHIAWTVTGTVPRRVGYTGREPVSWAFGDRKWDGWLKPDEIPTIKLPAPGAAPTDPAAAVTPAETLLAHDGFLWTANQRVVGGADLAKLGDNGYAGGARAGQIRDDLRRLTTAKKIVPADLLDIQLDDHALYLERWQKNLLSVLTDEAVGKNKIRGELREAVRQWNGRASIDSAAYRLVRSYHSKLAERALSPFFAGARESSEHFNSTRFISDDALWRLVNERPAALLNPAHESWQELQLAAADDVIADVEREGLPFARYTWGTRNTLHMQHPFSSFLPGMLARLLDMPAEQLPGDNDMPRVQGRAFGASERLVVSPGHEEEGILHLPGGQSGHPLSPYYRAGHEAWVKGEPTPLLGGAVQHTLTLRP